MSLLGTLRGSSAPNNSRTSPVFWLAGVFFAASATWYGIRDHFLDLLSSGLVLWVFITVVALCLSVALKSAKLSMALALALLFETLPLVQFYLSRSYLTDIELTAVKVLEVNLNAANNGNYQSIFKVIADERPDIVGVVELNELWYSALHSELDRSYPFSYSQKTCGGLAIFSRFPLGKTKGANFQGKERPRLEAVVNIGDKQITLILVHMATPHQNTYEFRLSDFHQLSLEERAVKSNLVVFGDFNCCPWTPLFCGLLNGEQMRDSCVGFGLQPTWCQGFCIRPMKCTEMVLSRLLL